MFVDIYTHTATRKINDQMSSKKVIRESEFEVSRADGNPSLVRYSWVTRAIEVSRIQRD